MHPKVFEWFRDNIVQIAGDVPFFATQNEMLQQKGLPDAWVTMEIVEGATQRLTVGTRYFYQEHGSVTAVFVAKSGQGVLPGLVAGQRFADQIIDNPSQYLQIPLVEDNGREGTLRISNVGTPDPAPFEDGNWHLCSVVCAYTYDSVRGVA